MKFVIAVASFLGGIAACYLLFSLGAISKVGGIPEVSKDVPQTVSIYLSFIGVMLTAVTVVLTALAIGIGIVAAITFAGLKTEARLIAETTAKDTSGATAKEVASEALSEMRIKGMVEAFLAVDIRERQQTAEWGEDPNETEER